MSYTGPVGLNKKEWNDWYDRLRNTCLAIAQRGYGLVCHPKHEAMLRDGLAQLAEDPRFEFAVPNLYTSRLVKEDEIRPVDQGTMRQMNMAQAMRSNRGFGRFTGLSVPKPADEHDPWKNLRDDPTIRPLQPDTKPITDD